MENNNDKFLNQKEAYAAYANMLRRLKDVSETLEYYSKINNVQEKINMLKQEIHTLGWLGICQKYHPDINMNDPAGFNRFKLYKRVYDIMKKNNEI
jgi:hypothetical protein